MISSVTSSLVEEIKNRKCVDLMKENEHGVLNDDYNNEAFNLIDLIIPSKQVEKCLFVGDVVSDLLDFDIFCLTWENIGKSVKSILSHLDAKVNSITFIIQEPLIDLLGNIIEALRELEKTGILVTNINIFVPYNSEIHIEYSKIMGILKYEYNNRSTTNFDFSSMQNFIYMEQKEKDKTVLRIKELNLKSLFYCDISALFGSKTISSICTCTEYTELLNPLLESDLDEIYKKVNIERKKNNNKYVIPKLFSVDSVRKNINLLDLDNLPLELKLKYSRHVLQMLTFILREFNIALNKANINLLSLGPSSKIISDTFYNSYNEIIRRMNGFNAKHEKEVGSNEITILFMDRSMDLISPIYSPIKNMNVSDEGIFTRFDDGTIEYMDELINKRLEYVQENSDIGSNSCEKMEAFEENYEKDMEQITNPIYLSIMLDPDKLQKDLLLSENYPVLSYKFISSLEDLEILVRSGEKEFVFEKRKSVVSKIRSLFRTNTKLFGDNSWLYLLSNIKQSNYTKLFWNQLLELQYKTCSLSTSRKRVLLLSTIKEYLRYIYENEIVDNNSNATCDFGINTESDNLSEECDIIKELVSVLLNIRTKLLPDSVTDILTKFENYDKSVFENSELSSLSIDATVFLGIIHIFLLQVFPIEHLNSYSSIFVKDLKKKFTTSSFENILTSNNDVYCSEQNNLYSDKMLSLAISCSSYEGPDCKLSHYGTGNTCLNSKIKLKLNDIRNSRSKINYKEYRNFQFSPLLPKKNNYPREFSTLISQILLTITKKNKSESDSQEEYDNFILSDLNMLRIKNNNDACKKTIIVNIIGNVSIYEILEIEKLSTLLKKEINNQEYKIIVLTDQLFSSIAFNNYFVS
ncbi:hypothetical protein FG386_003173 [Cryptosporidium ryanae]|uniref:uncharacterized protein n=1 Tax=Cryptosporidium ryanae TaxID=515981 RepID=UPI00351A6B21|nr:hypothetical protein FG386_003173 [Cryptosporidium ryanae]